MTLLLVIFLAGVWAGVQNTLAGGGSFVTLPALILSGMTPLAANITSTVALFPGQITAGYAGRKLASGAGHLPFRALFVLSLIGGAFGGLLLLHTSPDVFARLVPWLVLFATAVFTWGSFFRKPGAEGALHIGPVATGFAQFLIGVYGGYFGGGIGILMMAALTLAGQSARNAGGTKNVLAGVMNASAVALFLASPELHWRQALVLAVGAVIGGLLGTLALRRVNEKALRVAIVCIGVALTVGLFVKPL
nr:Sulfite exporter TauE/SafE [uncultured organism]